MMSAIFAAVDICNHRAEYDELQNNRMKVALPDTTIKPKGGKIIE